MRTLNRRIEKLEALVAQSNTTAHAIFECVLGEIQFCQGQIAFESLMSAFGADRTGRPLTQTEADAKRAYWAQVERDCKSQRIRVPSECPRDIVCYGILESLACNGYFDGYASGCQAHQEGREPNAEELIALEEISAQYTHLCQLAAVDPDEFHSFCESRS